MLDPDRFLPSSSPHTSGVQACQTHRVGTDLSLRLLALDLEASGGEAYQVSFSLSSGAPFRPGVMRHADGSDWDIVETPSGSSTAVNLGSPDDVFRLAAGGDLDARHAQVTRAAPHWPKRLTQRLAGRRLCGMGTVAFDARWFLWKLATSAVEQPLLLPNAASKLGLAGLETASAIVSSIAPPSATVVDVLRQACSTTAGDDTLEWDFEGRLIGEFPTGDLAQLGSDIRDGCQAAAGAGSLQVKFDPRQPLGLGLGPLRLADPMVARAGDSVGTGAYVGEVDAGGAAERAGVMPGMVLSRLREPDLTLGSDGPLAVPFERVLDEIDARRDAGNTLSVTFDTASAAIHLYAVEMPASHVLTAMCPVAASSRPPDIDAGAVLNALCGQALLWREDTPRLFLGDAGSITCAHTDICPRLELAHGLHGTKVIGIASPDATPRLQDAHAGDDEDFGEEPTWVPTDRPLTHRESQLLCDADLTLALLQTGDLAVFDSGLLHFASNGAEGLNCALYHGAITPRAIPRLRLAAVAPGGAHSGTDGAYRQHLHAADLLRLVEPRLAAFHRAQQRSP